MGLLCAIRKARANSSELVLLHVEAKVEEACFAWNIMNLLQEVVSKTVGCKKAKKNKKRKKRIKMVGEYDLVALEVPEEAFPFEVPKGKKSYTVGPQWSRIEVMLAQKAFFVKCLNKHISWSKYASPQVPCMSWLRSRHYIVWSISSHN